MSVLARFVGGPLNGVEQVLPNLHLHSPFLVRVERSNEGDAMGSPTYDEHRYDLDSRDYEARQAEIDRGSPALFVHEDLENVGRLLAASLGNLISFEEAFERVAEAFVVNQSLPTIGPPVDTGRLSDELTFHAADVDFIHHTPELHRASNCEELPPHERCWDSGGSGHVVLDPHGYGPPLFDEGSGASAEDLVPGIEAALREWNETKKEIEDDNDRD